MLYNAKNGCVNIAGDEMDYIAFGKGTRVMIMLPGIGDGLKTVKGMAIPFALMYRVFAKDFRVYVFSRRRHLPEAYSTREMARDQILAMDALGIDQADVIGVSMGGMIAQWMAIEHPQRINKLVLAVTSSRINSILKESVETWLDYARRGDYSALMLDSAKRMHTDEYLRRNRWILPVMTKVGTQKSFQRFMTMCNACLEHSAYEQLTLIKAKTLIVAGGRDKALGAEASKEMAEKISNNEIRIYEAYGHAVYEEEPDFNQAIMMYLLNK